MARLDFTAAGADRVVIIRIVHGARDLPQVMRE
jgi:plasmid stabilization system protein ParE